MSEKKVPIDQRLGAALKRARRSSGIPQWKVAEVLGFEQSTVGRWETGVRPIRLANLVQVCRVIGADPVEIVAEALGRKPEELAAEVDRLRTELETKSVVHECCEAAVELKKDRAHCKGLLADAERGEQEALAEAARANEMITAIRKMHQPVHLDGLAGPRCKASHGPAWVLWPCEIAKVLGMDKEDQ